MRKQIIGSNRPSGQPIASKKGEGMGGGGGGGGGGPTSDQKGPFSLMTCKMYQFLCSTPYWSVVVAFGSVKQQRYSLNNVTVITHDICRVV